MCRYHVYVQDPSLSLGCSLPPSAFTPGGEENAASARDANFPPADPLLSLFPLFILLFLFLALPSPPPSPPCCEIGFPHLVTCRRRMCFPHAKVRLRSDFWHLLCSLVLLSSLSVAPLYYTCECLKKFRNWLGCLL